MAIAKINHEAALSHFFKENVNTIDLTSSKYKRIDDVIAKVTPRNPSINSNDEISIENTSAKSSHLKLQHGKFLEGTPLPTLFSSKAGYFISDFSQKAYTLASYFNTSSITSSLEEVTSLSYNRNEVKLRMVGNLIGSITGSNLPSISGGFTSCIITKNGVPYYYINNGGTIYCQEESLRTENPWKTLNDEICCNILHCSSSLTLADLERVKNIFLSIKDASMLCASNLIECKNADGITASKATEVNEYIQKDL